MWFVLGLVGAGIGYLNDQTTEAVVTGGVIGIIAGLVLQFVILGVFVAAFKNENKWKF
jgi:hypothetical protein